MLGKLILFWLIKCVLYQKQKVYVVNIQNCVLFKLSFVISVWVCVFFLMVFWVVMKCCSILFWEKNVVMVWWLVMVLFVIRVDCVCDFKFFLFICFSNIFFLQKYRMLMGWVMIIIMVRGYVIVSLRMYVSNNVVFVCIKSDIWFFIKECIMVVFVVSWEYMVLLECFFLLNQVILNVSILVKMSMCMCFVKCFFMLVKLQLCVIFVNRYVMVSVVKMSEKV